MFVLHIPLLLNHVFQIQRGDDLPPKHLGNEETVPKSVARILNAEKIRLEFKEKKRKIDEPNGDECPQLKRKRPASDVNNRKEDMLKIQAGETIAHFNKWVSDQSDCGVSSLSSRAGESRVA